MLLPWPLQETGGQWSCHVMLALQLRYVNVVTSCMFESCILFHWSTILEKLNHVDN
jgi:hypothetical protein